MGRKLFIAFIKNFFTHFRRSLFMLFKSKNKPEMMIKLSENNSVVRKNVLQFQIELQNILFLIINGSIYPVLHDYTQIRLNIPLTKGSNVIEFIAVSLFKRKRQTITLDSQLIVSLAKLNPPQKKLIKPLVINNLSPQIYSLKELKLSSRVLVNLNRPASILLEIKGLNLKYDTDDLELELNKSYKYE